jgi:hypothetical protein
MGLQVLEYMVFASLRLASSTRSSLVLDLLQSPFRPPQAFLSLAMKVRSSLQPSSARYRSDQRLHALSIKS